MCSEKFKVFSELRSAVPGERGERWTDNPNKISPGPVTASVQCFVSVSLVCGSRSRFPLNHKCKLQRHVKGPKRRVMPNSSKVTVAGGSR